MVRTGFSAAAVLSLADASSFSTRARISSQRTASEPIAMPSDSESAVRLELADGSASISVLRRVALSAQLCAAAVPAHARAAMASTSPVVRFE
jgi:hypothetical protein